VCHEKEEIGGTNRMDSLKIKFAKSITLFTAGICIVSALVYGYFAPAIYTTAYPFLLGFFYLFGFVGVAVYSKALKRAPAKAANYYLAVRMAKMLILLLGAFIYCIFNRTEVITFLSTVAVMYLLYLVFETRFYYTTALAGNKKTKNDESK
jgi:hypothetical protein